MVVLRELEPVLSFSIPKRFSPSGAETALPSRMPSNILGSDAARPSTGISAVMRWEFTHYGVVNLITYHAYIATSIKIFSRREIRQVPLPWEDPL